MKCRECGGDTVVVDSRQSCKYGAHTVHRRRTCMSCGMKFKTLEYVLPEKKKKKPKSEVDKFLAKKYKKNKVETPEPVLSAGFTERAGRYATLPSHHMSTT